MGIHHHSRPGRNVILEYFSIKLLTKFYIKNTNNIQNAKYAALDSLWIIIFIVNLFAVIKIVKVFFTG